MDGDGMPTENLKKPRSTEEARAWGRNGGKASGEARRRKRDMRERLQALLDAKVDGVEGADALALALFEKALGGDTKAFELVAAHTGQAPRQKLEPINLPDVRTADDLPLYAAAVLRAVADGRLALDEADKLMRIASHVRNPVTEKNEGNIGPLGIIRPLSPREALAELVRHSMQMEGKEDNDDGDLNRLVAEARQSPDGEQHKRPLPLIEAGPYLE